MLGGKRQAAHPGEDLLALELVQLCGRLLEEEASFVTGAGHGCLVVVVGCVRLPQLSSQSRKKVIDARLNLPRRLARAPIPATST